MLGEIEANKKQQVKDLGELDELLTTMKRKRQEKQLKEAQLQD